MALIDLKIDGIARALAQIDKAGKVEEWAPIEAAEKKIKEAMARYPPERPNQRYVRTYKLRRGWTDERATIQRRGTGFEMAVRNRVSYGPYVQRDQSQPRPHQAWMHQGRWQTDEQVARQLEDEIAADFEREVRKVVK